MGTLTLLEAIRITEAGIRLYDAGSTECFGNTGDTPANENTKFRPRSPYAVAKASSFWAVANYREAYNLFACTGILSNHDSPIRPRRFVTRKIIHAAASLALQRDARLTLGNLQVSRELGLGARVCAGDCLDAGTECGAGLCDCHRPEPYAG